MRRSLPLRRSLLVSVSLLALVLANGASRAASTPLEVRLSPGAGAGELVFSLVNTSDEPIGVLLAGTPLEATLSEDVFLVTRRDGASPPLARAPYTGRHAKRAPPRADDVVAIAPGGSLAATLLPARHYAIPHGGVYRVRFAGEIRQVALSSAAVSPDGATPRGRPPFAPRAVRPAANALDLPLEPDLADLARARPPAFAACDAGQRDRIVEATVAAEGLVAESVASLRGLPEAQRPTSPRYRRWFGAHDPARYESVTTGYARLLDSLSGATLNFDCGCDEPGVYAFVRPILLHDINLCPLFFEAPLLGTDSQAGTLVHELSHFTALIGTDDTVYSQGAATALATRDPALAIDNADNVEYFAENTPGLPMTAAGVPDTDAPTVPVPDAGSGAGAFVSLENGVERRGSVAERESDRYTVSGVDVVGVLSDSGDADLYVYDDPALGADALVCRAVGDGSESPIDYCELPDETRPWYVVVFGFSAADYRIVADTVDVPSDAGPVPNALPDGRADGELARGQSVTYVANAPLRIELTSTRGDADLLVFAGTRASADGELCRSTETDGTDVCELGGDGPVLIVVAGFSASTFRLETSDPGGGANAGTGSEPADDDPAAPPLTPPDPVAAPADDAPGTTPPGSAGEPAGGPFAEAPSGAGAGGGGGAGGLPLLVGALLAGLARRLERAAAPPSGSRPTAARPIGARSTRAPGRPR